MQNNTKLWEVLLVVVVFITTILLLFSDIAKDDLWVFIIWSILAGIATLMAIMDYKSENRYSFRKIKDEEIFNLVKTIHEIRMQDVRDEEDFEKQLFQRLDAKGYNVKRQERFGSGKVIDLVVENNIGIELKVADRSKNVQDLIGQVTIYKKYLKKIIVVILDTGVVDDLEEYIEHIRDIDKEGLYLIKKLLQWQIVLLPLILINLQDPLMLFESYSFFALSINFM